MNDIIVINNVFSSPNEITNLAFSHHFYKLSEHPLDSGTHITWSGTKTLPLNTILSKPLYENIISQIISKIGLSDVNNTVSMFHSFTEDNQSSENWFHTDNTKLGGVVYLNNVYPKNPSDHGTMIIKGNEQIIIPYEYNKLVIYPSNYVHRPMNGFGNSLESSRLTLNFFIR
jgi:hypothetical protein